MGGTERKKKPPLVSWDRISVPKKYGGLNIKGCRNWNITSIGKLIWQLAEKQDSLWIKWVHDLYMKNDSNIWMHNPPMDCSWYWKKINFIKSSMISWFTNGRYILSSIGRYSISLSYNALIGMKVRWRISELVSIAFAQPKHRFILWLAVRNRLLTKERLSHLNIPVDSPACSLCSTQST